MRKRVSLSVPRGVLLLAVLACGGCASNRDAETAFAEGEALRVRYERQASLDAIVAYREALETWKRMGDAPGAARACRQIGVTYEQLGALEPSLNSYLEAVDHGHASRDRLLESAIRADTGIAHARLSQYPEATEQCRIALDLARRLGSASAEARALICRGEVEYHRGDSSAALASYLEAMPLWDKTSDVRGRAETLFLLGSAYSDLNELDRGTQILSEALQLWREVGDVRGELIARNALARLQDLPGEYQEALNRHISLSDRFREAGDTVWEAASLTGIAWVYEQMGDRRSASRYWQEAARRFEAAGLEMAVLEMYVRIGSGYLESDVSAALDWLARARAASASSGNRHMESYALRYLGLAHLAQGDPVQALRRLEESWGMQQQFVDDPRFRVGTLCDLARAHQAAGNVQEAAKRYRQSLALARDARDRAGQAMAFFGLARISALQDDLASAQTNLEAALKLAESLRTEVEASQLRASYVASVSQYYELRTDLLMRRHERHPGGRLAAAAFESSEQARARSLLDSLATARVDLQSGLEAGLLERLAAAEKAIDGWAERQRTATNDVSRQTSARASADEYRDLERRYDQVQAEIRSKSPRYADLVTPQPLSLAEIQRQLLDDNTLLLEYALGDDRSYVWAVSSARLSGHLLPPRAEIEQLAQGLHDRLVTDSSRTGRLDERHRSTAAMDAEYWQDARRLSEILLGPVASAMKGKRLVIVADGALHYVPFAALPVPDGEGNPVPLAVEHEIVGLPSASVLTVLRRETAGRQPRPGWVAVLADPVFEVDDPRLRNAIRRSQSGARPGLTVSHLTAPPGVARLAGTRLEADAIVSAGAGGATLKKLDFDASRATAMSRELSNYRIVHFATHGVFDHDNPGLSGVVLSMFDDQGRAQDGLLRLHDIYRLDLPADLVVLSACNTALGQQVRGEGLIGIVRGFMYAGAPRVVASLWKVDDEATTELMRHFYAEMRGGHRAPADALRRAQLALYRQDRWRSPYYWAAFVLQGEWRP